MTTHSATISLQGLREDIPRDFLAALGFLDWLSDLFVRQRPQLAWCLTSGHPVLHLSDPLPDDWPQLLLDALQQWRRKEPNPFGHGKIEGIQPQKLREILSASGIDSKSVRFYCGLSSQLYHDGAGRRSELIIESASRSVLKGSDDLLGDVGKPLDLQADLLGRGVKREVSNTSRWHPAEYQPAAHVATDPQYNKHRDWVGLNILALLGTGFYPVVDTKTGRTTPGVRRTSGVTEFSWPVWETPLNVDEVRGLVLHPACHDDPFNGEILRRMGVRGIWRSRKFKPDGNNDYFATARPA